MIVGFGRIAQVAAPLCIEFDNPHSLDMSSAVREPAMRSDGSPRQSGQGGVHGIY